MGRYQQPGLGEAPAVYTNSGFRSLFDRPASIPSGYDPDQHEKRKCEAVGNRYLESLGYRPHREAAIGLALTAALWERWNGSLDSRRSPVDWIIELGHDGIGTGEPWGTGSSERDRRRQEDRQSRARALNACLREYIEREWPGIAKFVKPTDQSLDTDGVPTADELVGQGYGAMQNLLPQKMKPRGRPFAKGFDPRRRQHSKKRVTD